MSAGVKEYVIEAIQNFQKHQYPVVDAACRNAVERRKGDDASDAMERASHNLARLCGMNEMATFTIEKIHCVWPSQPLALADDLAEKVRAILDCDCNDTREKLKFSYFRYIKERGIEG